MSKTTPRAVVAAIASGILLFAIAQAADVAAIKSPVGSAAGTVARAPPITTDSGEGCGPRGRKRCGGYFGGLQGYGNGFGVTTLQHERVHQ